MSWTPNILLQMQPNSCRRHGLYSGRVEFTAEENQTLPSHIWISTRKLTPLYDNVQSRQITYKDYIM